MTEHYLLQSSDTINNKVITGQSASLVKTTNINLPSKWNSKRLCTEHVYTAHTRSITLQPPFTNHIQLKPCFTIACKPT